MCFSASPSFLYGNLWCYSAVIDLIWSLQKRRFVIGTEHTQLECGLYMIRIHMTKVMWTRHHDELIHHHTEVWCLYSVYCSWSTVPLKSKLTVPQASRLDSRSSIVLSIESQVSRIESRVSSIELRVEKVNELVAWLIPREINCTNGLPVLRAIVPLSLAITKMSATDCKHR